MPSAFRYQTLARWMIGIAIILGALLVFMASRVWIKASDAASASGIVASIQAPFTSVPVSTGQNWTVFLSQAAKAAPGATSLAPERFRLAGTFFIEGAGAPTRRAILDDSSRREQFIVSEGERLDDTTVESISYDHVTLRGPAGLRELWVEFSARQQSPLPLASTNRAEVAGSATNKFGCIKTDENRWKFSRKPLLDYYQELLDEPDRMVAVFDTMKPVRDDQNKITGYVVGIEGEKNFFDSVGLQQGDIVRSVNSLPMTNRRRAEAMIDQFLKDRMNVVVLDVERGGKVTKQVYQMQP